MSDSFIGNDGKEYRHVMVLGRMTLCEVIKPKPLKKNQIKALKELGEPGHFRVNWRPNLSPDAYRDLKDRGLIQEAWTWASTTRPDVSITEAGVAAVQTL